MPLFAIDSTAKEHFNVSACSHFYPIRLISISRQPLSPHAHSAPQHIVSFSINEKPVFPPFSHPDSVSPLVIYLKALNKELVTPFGGWSVVFHLALAEN